MSVTISLQPEFESQFIDEARVCGISLSELVARRAMEADLLWQIRTAAPEAETRQLHRLLRRRNKGLMSDDESGDFQKLLNAREERGAQRLSDLILLAQLRSLPVHSLKEQLGIHPLASP